MAFNPTNGIVTTLTYSVMLDYLKDQQVVGADGNLYFANGVIAAGTAFALGATGATWRLATRGASAIKTITAAAYTITLADFTILVDSVTQAIIITLPTVASAYNAASGTSFTFNIKNIGSSANTVTLKGNGTELIDGANTKVVSPQYGSFTVQCNNTAWYIM